MHSATTTAPFLLERRPSTFLSLAPTTSASYPTIPKTPVQPLEAAPVEQDNKQVDAEAGASPAPVTATPAVSDAEEISELLKTRRSSSSASDGSSKRGYLKLGPVHFGEGDGDWSEDVITV